MAVSGMAPIEVVLPNRVTIRLRDAALCRELLPVLWGDEKVQFLLHRLFGRKTEKIDPRQLQLLLQEEIRGSSAALPPRAHFEDPARD